MFYTLFMDLSNTNVHDNICTQCVPYLMAMSTDPDSSIKVKADQHLTDHTSRYGPLMQVSQSITISHGTVCLSMSV